VYVIVHEAVTEYAHAMFVAVLREKIDVTHSILIFEEHGLSIVSAMGNVVRNPREHYALFAWHNSRLKSMLLFVKRWHGGMSLRN
jgi:prolipoprotein diacylglyceryltransferase